jgi:hypothetical protein
MDIFPCLPEFLVSLEDKADESKPNIKQKIISDFDSLHGKTAHYFQLKKEKCDLGLLGFWTLSIIQCYK